MKQKPVLVGALLSVVLVGAGLGWKLFSGEQTETAIADLAPAQPPILPIVSTDPAAEPALDLTGCAEPPCKQVTAKNKSARTSESLGESGEFALATGWLDEDDARGGSVSAGGNGGAGRSGGSGGSGSSVTGSGGGGFGGGGSASMAGSDMGLGSGGPGSIRGPRSTVAKARGGDPAVDSLPIPVSNTGIVAASKTDPSPETPVLKQTEAESAAMRADAGSPVAAVGTSAIPRAIPSLEVASLPTNPPSSMPLAAEVVAAGPVLANGNDRVVPAAADRLPAAVAAPGPGATPPNPGLEPAGNPFDPTKQQTSPIQVNVPTVGVAALDVSNQIPEPGSLALIGIALLAAIGAGRRSSARNG